jgi:hypothetical protein
MLSSSLAPFFRLRILSLISRARLPRDPGEEVGEDESGNSYESNLARPRKKTIAPKKSKISKSPDLGIYT